MLCNEEMRKSILSRLQGYRYEHSLGVERAAIMLAEKYGEDPEKAGAGRKVRRGPGKSGYRRHFA